MSVQVTVKIDHPKLQAEVSRMSEQALRRAANTSEARMKAILVSEDLINTGKLVGSIKADPISGNYPEHYVLIGTPLPYAKYTEYGTRAHGPVTAQALRFKPKGASAYVFAKWVRGITPYRWAQKTLDMVRPSDFV